MFSLGKGHLPAWFYKCKNMWEVSPTSSTAGQQTPRLGAEVCTAPRTHPVLPHTQGILASITRPSCFACHVYSKHISVSALPTPTACPPAYVLISQLRPSINNHHMQP